MRWNLQARPHCEYPPHYSVHATEQEARAELASLCKDWLLELRFDDGLLLVDWNDPDAVIDRCHDKIMSCDGGGYVIKEVA